MIDTMYVVKKQVGDRIWVLREDNEWTCARHFKPWLGDKMEATKKMKIREELEGGRKPKARYYIESTDWEELHV